MKSPLWLRNQSKTKALRVKDERVRERLVCFDVKLKNERVGDRAEWQSETRPPFVWMRRISFLYSE